MEVIYESNSFFKKEQQFLSQLKKLQNFASKNGLEPVTILSRKETIEEVEIATFVVDGRAYYTGSIHYPIQCVEFDITGDVPSFNGWEVVAEVFQKDDVLGCSGDNYKPDSMVCDHCGTNRSRDKTYILKSTDGEIKQVASTCVKHFVGVELGQFFSNVQLFKTSVEVLPEMMEVEEVRRDLDYCEDHVFNTLKKYTTLSKEEIIKIWEQQEDSIVKFFLALGGLPNKSMRGKLYEPIFNAQNELDKKTEHFGVEGKREEINLEDVKCVLTVNDQWTGKTKYKYSAKVKGCLVEFYHKDELTDNRLQVKATVKEHKTYREKKITYLNRVTII